MKEGKARGQNYWKEHSESWKGSGLTQQAYCSREGISYKSFVYQHNRVNSKEKKSSVHFIEAKIQAVDEARVLSGMQIELPNGVRISISGEVTSGLMQAVFQSAASMPC